MQTNGFRARAMIGFGLVPLRAPLRPPGLPTAGAAPILRLSPGATLGTALVRIAERCHGVRWLAVVLTAVISIGALASAVDRQRGAAGGAVGAGSPASADTSSVVDTYGRLPMIFEANAGQADPSVRYVARGAGYTLSLTEREAVLSLIADEASGRTAVVRMATVGSAPSPAISGVDPQPGRVNYLTGDDRSAWRTDVPTFGGVRYSSVYPGIDLVYYGNQQQLEYDFVLAPRADPTVIRLAFTGADGIRLSEGGDLVLDVDGRELVQRAPVVYQDAGGSRQTIPSRYVIEGEQITFSLGAYDRSLPLVIDPVIGYSTFLGGTSGEIGYGIAVDSAGNAYIAGQTTSTDFPTANPFQASHGGDDFDAFVAKLNSAGTALVYATYLGGSGFDQARDIAVDSAGIAYVAGVTSSTNFPTANSVQATLQGLEDGFVVKLNQAGSALIYGSYLGAAGDDAATAIAVDGSGNAYLTGWTDSVSFPTVNPIQSTKGGFVDAFVTKVNAAGSTIVYSTYLGGNLDDLGHGIAVDGTGAAYVAGETLSSNFPTANSIQAASGGRYDGFVTKVNPFGEETPYTELDGYVRDTAGEDGARWPDLSGETLTILDHGAFTSKDDAVSRFENLTGVKVKVEDGGDAGSALKKLTDRRGDGTYDIIYGLDQAYLGKADALGLLTPYKPALADRIQEDLVFFGSPSSQRWPATPVDHGYVAVNVDPHYRGANGTDPFRGERVDSLAKVRKYADLLAVPSPVNSSPGLAFLLTTIATYGENPDYGTPYYDWKAYWRDLLQGTSRAGRQDPACVLIAKDWSDAYEQHFSGGYGAPPEGKGLGDKPLVVSYTESPAYEVYFGREPGKAAQLVLEPGSTWHQVQTMAIANGTRHLAAAQAWIEYTLTDHFQGMRADPDGVYPAVAGISTDDVYGTLDPDPGSFRPARMDYARIGANLDTWLKEWRKLAEDPNVNCRL